MRCFDSSDPNCPWDEKVNYVDKNNRVVGFDVAGQCCEEYGHGVFTDRYGGSEFDGDLEPYEFSEHEEPQRLDSMADSGGVVIFTLWNGNTGDRLYLRIWNVHNGYYTHGFSWWEAKERL